MKLKFDKLYYRNDRDGLLEMCFVNSKVDSFLFFDGGSFLLKDHIMEFNEVFLEYLLEKKENQITALRENDDMDFILGLNEASLIKIYFYPNDFYPNGVGQIFKIYKPDDRFYSELLSDFEKSQDIILMKSSKLL